MFCPNDGIENREGAKRCKKCGACLNCGEKEPGEKICRKCRIPLTDTGIRQCANGHSLPPGSERCDICEQNAVRASQQTNTAGVRRRDTEIDDLPPIQAGRESAAAPRQRRATQFANAQASGAIARKIVGILVTYSWKKEGEIFEVREGRNLIGSDAECDIQLEHDPGLSGKHAAIVFLKTFVIGDMFSMSGTFVDGEPVESERMPLRNGASIRTGGTVWTFLSIPIATVKDDQPLAP